MTTQKLLVVFGATGQQGGSLINYILQDQSLSKDYRIRAVTRNSNQPSAQSLQNKGVEVVRADADDADSLRRALRGSSITFAATMPIFNDQDARGREVAQGKAIADAAVTEGAQYVIFNTPPHAAEISGGKYQKVDHFDAKAEVGGYMRSLPTICSIFYAPGWSMQNFNQHMSPRRMPDGALAIVNIISPQTKLALIDPYEDTGKFLGPVLADPEAYIGKTLSAATRHYSYEEALQIMSKVWRVPIEYRVVSKDVYASNVGPVFGERLVQMMLYLEECGYYSPRGMEEVDLTASIATQKLTTFEEYLARNPVDVDINIHIYIERRRTSRP